MIGYCDTCAYFKTYSVDAYLGECRRYAPRPCLEGDPGASAPSAGWPKVCAEDGCGEFEARQTSPADKQHVPNSERHAQALGLV